MNQYHVYTTCSKNELQNPIETTLRLMDKIGEKSYTKDLNLTDIMDAEMCCVSISVSLMN